MAITQGNTGSGGSGGSVIVTSLPSTPAGSSTIGKVDQGVGGVSAWKVDGSAVVQPVSGTVAVSSLPTLPAGSNTIGKTDQGVGGVSAWKVDGSGVTQPVSGTVAVSALPALPAGTNVIGQVQLSKAPALVSTANSSTTPLTGAAVFTGTSEDVSGYAALVVNVIADQAGTLSPQFSSNGTNWDFVGSHAIAAGTGQMFVFRPGSQFFRLVYTNGATPQGAFRLQAVYHPNDVDIATVQPLGAGMANPTTQQMGANLLVQPAGGTTWSPAAADSGARLVLGAGSQTAGNVGGMEAFPTATFTRPADTTPYAANDAICNSTTVPAAMTFANAALRSGGGGFVVGATILDEANQTTKLNATLHLFSAVPGTLTNDNAPMAFANADLANWQGALRFTTTAVTNTASGASGSVMLFAPVGGSFPYKCGATSLFGVLQADNAYTPVSAEVFLVTLQLSQDA